MADKMDLKIKSLGNSDKEPKEKLKKELDHKRNVENKSNMMIITTLILYVICRLPELLGIIYFYDNKLSKFVVLCQDNILCSLLDNIIEYLYLISYCTNILFYYKFNNNFQKGFRNYFNFEFLKKKEHS